MIRRLLRPSPAVGVAVATGLCLSVLAIVWIGYLAIREWQTSARQLAERTAERTVELIATTLTRDMRAVQTSVLAVRRPKSANDAPETVDVVASAFARYPYPEVFFGFEAASPAAGVFYCRSDRYPPWIPRSADADEFPVGLSPQPAIAHRLMDRIASDAKRGRLYSVFNIELGSIEYQAVVHLVYADALHQQLTDVFGFLVNLQWVQQHYVQTITDQVSRIRDASSDLALRIVDERGRVLDGGAPLSRDSAVIRRTVPSLFFDPQLVAVYWPVDLGHRAWTIEATVGAAPVLARAQVGARRTFAFAAVAALIFLMGFVLLVQASRAHARLTELRAEFVSSVTHELKTPITTIQAISETFARGRPVTPEVSRKYGRLALHETKRLKRLIDNLLAYARITDVTELYSFEALAPRDLVEQTVRDFGSQLEYREFEVHLDIPSSLPAIRADRKAMTLALGNLVDNAIRYSPESRCLEITARVNGNGVAFAVTDRGVGIPEADIPHVTRKFFRGRREDFTGSGLGLAIVDRVVTDHRGSLAIRSAVGIGTTVSILLPFAEVNREEASARS